MTAIFETEAALDLIDRVTPKLEKIAGAFGVFDERVLKTQAQLDKLTLGPFVKTSAADLEKVTGLSRETVAKMTAGFDTLGAKTAPGFAGMKAEADRAFGSVLGAARGLPAEVAEQLSRLGALTGPEFEKMVPAATSAFGKVIDEVKGLNTGIAESLAGLGEISTAAFAAIPNAARVAGAEAVAAIRASMGEISALKASVAIGATGAASAASVLPQASKAAEGEIAGMAGKGIAGRTGRDFHFGRVGGTVGGVHISASGNTALAAAGLALDGVYEAAQIDDVVAKALMTSQIPIGAGVSKTDAGKRIHDMIQHASKQTGFNFHDTGEGILEGQRLLQQMPFGTRNDLIEKILPSAAYEARLKGSTLPEALEAIIGIAHQTQTYDPAGVEKIANDLAFTSTLTPSPLPQFQKALGYSVPELHNGLGMDAGTLMLLTATMQQSGIQGTRSGTWLRSFFENSEPGSDEHNAALRKLGMLNDDNKPTWRVTGADGQIDWQKSVGALSGILHHDQQSIAIDERIGLLRKAYGERGAGFASLMMGERFTENLSAATKGMGGFKGGDDLLSQYGDASILQQSRVALQDFNVAMSDLGTKLMPAATSAVRDFSEIMRTIDADGPKGLLKLFFDRAIKSDLGPIPSIVTGAANGPNMRPLTHEQVAWMIQHPGQQAAELPTTIGAGVTGAERLARARISGIALPDDDRSTRSRASDALPWLKELQEKEQQSIWRFGQLNDQTGILHASFTTLNTGSGVVTSRFSDLGGGAGGLNSALGILTQTAMGAASALASVALGGGAGSGGGSGIINASYEGGDSGAGGGGGTSTFGGRGSASRGVSGGWTPSANDPSFASVRDGSGFDWRHMGVQMGAKSAYLGNHLKSIGATEIAAAAMLGHASVESNFKVDAYNPRLESSHGLFQWNDAVRRWSPLLAWAKKNGRNPNDPLAQLDYAKVESMHMRGPHGMSVWDAMQHAGSLDEANRIWMDHFEAPKHRDYGNRLAAGQRVLNAMRSLGSKVHADVPTVVAPPPRQAAPAPSQPQGGPSSGGHMISAENMPPQVHEHHITLKLDGKVLTKHVVAGLASDGRFPRNMGGPNHHGSYVSPGTPITDCAFAEFPPDRLNAA